MLKLGPLVKVSGFPLVFIIRPFSTSFSSSFLKLDFSSFKDSISFSIVFQDTCPVFSTADTIRASKNACLSVN